MSKTGKPLDIAIAGCGPAGLAAALFLSRAGHRVTLFDQFDEPRPLGSGLILQPTGLAVLAELGLDAQILALGQRIDRLYGRVSKTQRIVLDVRYATLGPEMFGLAVHRSALFSVLYDAVRRAGIAVETGRKISGAERVSDSCLRLVHEEGRSSGPFDLVIDALGVRSTLTSIFDPSHKPRADLTYGALWATLPWPAQGFDLHSLEQRYERSSAMIGVLPIGRAQPHGPDLAALFWSIKPPSYQQWLDDGLDAWKSNVLRLWPQTEPLLNTIRHPDELTLARYCHSTLASPIAPGAVAIGDAAHAASPQLGQGANMALLDARALALALEEAPDLETALKAYARARRPHVRFYQALSFGFTPAYQSDSRFLPVLRDWVIAPATRLPGIRKFVAASVAGIALDPRTHLRLPSPIKEAVSM
ncbi:FAD-dependent oxidoreductase [Microvirga solisilvae]|uniref:FAD-dependent oxidoreductase n=1 Tax=Microvirga solisilvae TaxID=2919498 RepID=UPI001FAFC121|nr:NAD(P)/FAD-dependent oxidoreductase [Microvirga solisilvae]